MRDHKLLQGLLTNRLVYINQLQEEYKNYCIKFPVYFSRKEMLQDTGFTPADTVLITAFRWTATPQGFDFWSAITETINDIVSCTQS